MRDYPCGGHERPAETLPAMYLPNKIYLYPCFLISLFFFFWIMKRSRKLNIGIYMDKNLRVEDFAI